MSGFLLVRGIPLVLLMVCSARPILKHRTRLDERGRLRQVKGRSIRLSVLCFDIPCTLSYNIAGFWMRSSAGKHTFRSSQDLSSDRSGSLLKSQF